MPSPERVKELKELIRQKKQERRDILQQKKDYRNANLIEFFNRPRDEDGIPANPLQAELLDAWDNQLYKVFTFTGGNRVGKTTIGTVIAISVVIGRWLWNNKKIYFPHNKPRKVRYIGQDWKSQIEKVVIPELRKWWPKKYQVDCRGNGIVRDALWTDKKTGGTIELMSNYQDSDVHEGWSGDLICIEENQLVLMADGRWKAIKDVDVDDLVWTIALGNVRSKQRVLKKIDNGIRDVVKLKLAGGIQLICTPDHEVYIRSKNKNAKSEKKRVCDLSRDDQIYCPLIETGNNNTNDFFKMFKPLLFFLGAWIGDGWCDKKRVNIATANDEFRGYLSSGIINGYKLKHRKLYDYEIQPSNGIYYDFLKSLGINDKKAHAKYIPSEIFTLDDSSKIEFIRGLISTDGWIINTGIGYGSTSELLIRDFHRLLRSLSIHSTIQFKKSQKEGVWRDQWFLMVNKSGAVLRLLDLLEFVPGKSFEAAYNAGKQKYLNCVRKDRRSLNARKNFRTRRKTYRRSVQYHRFKSVEKVGKARVYDLTVDKHHNFICECIQVSNCYDEPPKREIRIANSRGLIDRNGRELFCMTLLKEAWVDREVIKAVDENGKPDRTIFSVNGDIWSNVGFGITKEGVEQFAKTLTEAEKDARLRGIPSYMSGLVCPDLKRTTHVIERFRIPTDYVIDIAIDIHPRKEQAVLFIATNAQQLRYCCFEIWDHGDGPQTADKILMIVNRNALRVNRIICDPLAKGDSNNENTTYDKMQNVFSAHGYYLETATKDKQSGIIEINNHLKGPNNQPSLFIFRDLVRTIHNLEGWMYDEDTQKPSKEDDDMCENLYRLLLLDTKYIPIEDEEYEEEYYSNTVNEVTGY